MCLHGQLGQPRHVELAGGPMRARAQRWLLGEGDGAWCRAPSSCAFLPGIIKRQQMEREESMAEIWRRPELMERTGERKDGSEGSSRITSEAAG